MRKTISEINRLLRLLPGVQQVFAEIHHSLLETTNQKGGPSYLGQSRLCTCFSQPASPFEQSSSLALASGIFYCVGTIFGIHIYLWESTGIHGDLSLVPVGGNAIGMSGVMFRERGQG